MRKLNYLFFLLAVPAMITFTGCGDSEEDPEPDGCGTDVFPTTNGTSSISFANYPDNTANDPNNDDIIDINTSAGEYISFAVEINKGTSGNRPQKLRVYSTECENQLGSAVKFPGQPYTEDGDYTIDLRNSDQQVRTILYQVPTGVTTTYLNFEVDESSKAYTYARVKLNISGSGVVGEYDGIELGAQNNSLASRLSSGTGLTYTSCDAAQNIQYIDITYAEVGPSITTEVSYLSSNPARFTTPLLGLTNSNPTGCGDGDEAGATWSTAGGTTTYFKDVTAKISPSQFAAITSSNAIDTISFSGVTAQYIAVTANKVIAFRNSLGGTNKQGLILVNSITAANTSVADGKINIDVKVSR